MYRFPKTGLTVWRCLQSMHGTTQTFIKYQLYTYSRKVGLSLKTFTRFSMILRFPAILGFMSLWRVLKKKVHLGLWPSSWPPPPCTRGWFVSDYETIFGKVWLVVVNQYVRTVQFNLHGTWVWPHCTVMVQNYGMATCSIRHASFTVFLRDRINLDLVAWGHSFRLSLASYRV